MLGRVSERRRQQLMELESRMADLRRQLTEQKKLLKLKEQKEKEAVKMNSEIQVGRNVCHTSSDCPDLQVKLQVKAKGSTEDSFNDNFFNTCIHLSDVGLDL